MDTGKFEYRNPDISVNILVYEDKEVFPLYTTSCRRRQHHVKLLLIQMNKLGTSINSRYAVYLPFCMVELKAVGLIMFASLFIFILFGEIVDAVHSRLQPTSTTQT